MASAIENARLYAAARGAGARAGAPLARSESISARRVAGRAAAGRRQQSLALLRAEQRARLPRWSRTTGCGARACADRAPTRRRPSASAELSASSRRGGGVDGTGGRAGDARGRPDAPGTLTAPLSADDELIGFLVARAARRPARSTTTIATSPPRSRRRRRVGIKKIRLIEGLEERNLIKDFFADLLAAGRGARDSAAARAAWAATSISRSSRWSCVPWRGEPRSAAEARASSCDRFEAACGRALPGVLFDRREDELRAARARCSAATSPSRCELHRGARRERRPLPLVVGVSNPCVGTEAIATGFEEAQQAARALPVITNRPAIVPFDGLGPYKYLLRVPLDDRVRDRHREALRVLPSTTGRARRSSPARSRSSCASAATSRRRRRRCTCTPTRCASACGGSPT